LIAAHYLDLRKHPHRAVGYQGFGFDQNRDFLGHYCFASGLCYGRTIAGQSQSHYAGSQKYGSDFHIVCNVFAATETPRHPGRKSTFAGGKPSHCVKFVNFVKVASCIAQLLLKTAEIPVWRTIGMHHRENENRPSFIITNPTNMPATTQIHDPVFWQAGSGF